MLEEWTRHVSSISLVRRKHTGIASASVGVVVAVETLLMLKAI